MHKLNYDVDGGDNGTTKQRNKKALKLKAKNRITNKPNKTKPE